MPARSSPHVWPKFNKHGAAPPQRPSILRETARRARALYILPSLVILYPPKAVTNREQSSRSSVKKKLHLLSAHLHVYISLSLFPLELAPTLFFLLSAPIYALLYRSRSQNRMPRYRPDPSREPLRKRRVRNREIERVRETKGAVCRRYR